MKEVLANIVRSYEGAARGGRHPGRHRPVRPGRGIRRVTLPLPVRQQLGDSDRESW